MLSKTQLVIKKNKYIGAIHIHSLYSDGTGDIQRITKAAQKANLDWIVITDHNNLDIEEGIINGVTVIKGEEISNGDANHYIALGINEKIEPTEPNEFTEKVRQLGGFGFIAHPDESLTRNNSARPIRWLDSSVNPDGIEIWNWFSQWADKYNDRNIFKQIYSYLFKHNLVSAPYPQTLYKWDKLNDNNEHIIPAIGGLDAHALRITNYLIPVTIFPYETLFKTITNIVLLDEKLADDFETRKVQILNALKQGNNIIINRKICNSFPNVCVENGFDTVSCGEKITLSENTFLKIDLPKEGNVWVIKDGGEYKYLAKQKECNIKLSQAGKYRVEVEINNKGFAYTNPIVVTQN